MFRSFITVMFLLAVAAIAGAQSPVLDVVRTIDGDEDAMLFRPDALAFGPDGSYYVLNAGDCRVLQFDGDWALVRAFGREGEGPGEFANPTGMVLYHDRIWVFEMMRATLFSLGGEYLETRTSRLEMHEPLVTDQGLIVRLGSNERLAALLDDQLALVRKIGPECPVGDFMAQFRACGFVRALSHPDFLCLLLNPFDGTLYALDDAGDVARELSLVADDGASTATMGDDDDSISMSFTLVMGTGGIDRHGLLWTVPLPPDAAEDDPQTLVVRDRELAPLAEYVLPEDVAAFRVYHGPDGRLILLDGASSQIHVCAYPDGLADSGS